MLTRLILVLLVALGGAGLTLQATWNARLRAATGSPVLATLVSVGVTLVWLSALWTGGVVERGALPAFGAVPFWAWCGGLLGGVYLVVSLLALPKLGAAAVFAIVVAGQMITALIVDTTGAFGVAPVGPTVSRVLGVGLVIAGAILLQRR